jgi:polyferredoxin
MRGIFSGCFLLFALQFAASLFFGRAFCGWVCPCAGVEECCGVINNKTAKYGKKRFIKYFVWMPWILSILLLFISAGGIKEFDPLFLFLTYTSELPMFGSHSYIVYFGIVLLIAILSMTVGRRAFCHTICWMSPFMVIGIKIKNVLRYPSLKIKTNSAKCTSCGLCNKNCPMNLNVQKISKTGYVRDVDCILCGKCVDICKHDVLKYSVKK